MARLRCAALLTLCFVGALLVPGRGGAAGPSPVSGRLCVVSDAFLAAQRERDAASSHESAVEVSRGGRGAVYLEPVDGKVRAVHRGKKGEPHAEIFNVLISADGRRTAYVVRDEDDRARLVVDGRERLPLGPDDEHAFTPNGRHHLATVARGDRTLLVVDGRVRRKYRLAGFPLVSGDSRTLAFPVKSLEPGRLRFVVTDLRLRRHTVLDSCGESYLASGDGSRIAVACSDGERRTLKIVDFRRRRVLSTVPYEGDMTHFRFTPDGRAFAYTVARSDETRAVVFRGRGEEIPPGQEVFSDPFVLAEPDSVGVLAGTVYKAGFRRAFAEEDRTGKEYGYVSDLTSSRDLRSYAYVAVNVGEERMHVVVNGREGPTFDKVVAPVFSPDGRFLVYRARDAGRRFVVVSDLEGKVLRRHPDHDMIFQPVFTRDGRSVAYAALDGNELWWRVEKL